MDSTRGVPGSVSASDAAQVVAVARELLTVDEAEAAACICGAVRRIVGADGSTFVLSEGDQVYYAEEDAIASLWKGRRFPANACISGWAVAHHETAVIEDVYEDPRIPVEAYKPTFVKSLCTTPVGGDEPMGALGAYWRAHHRASDREVWLLEQLAAIAHVAVIRSAGRAPRSHSTPPEGDEARLLAVIAHDLRQPLSTIRQNGELLLDDSHPPTRQAAARVARAADRASQLVSQLSQFSELSRGSLRLVVGESSLDQLCYGVAASLDPTGQRIRIDAAPARGLIDRARIEQVLSNLVGNALQHGHPAHPVTIRLRCVGGHAHLAVHNHGEVIRIDQRDAAFNPFHRLKDTKGRGSVGLGLYIAQQIVRAHGGSLDVSSSEDDGTTFTATFPIAATNRVAG